MFEGLGVVGALTVFTALFIVMSFIDLCIVYEPSKENKDRDKGGGGF